MSPLCRRSGCYLPTADAPKSCKVYGCEHRVVPQDGARVASAVDDHRVTGSQDHFGIGIPAE
jgi:hypothetical protein